MCHGCEGNEAKYWCNADCKKCFCNTCWDAIHSVGQYKKHPKIEVKDRPKEKPRCQENHDDRLEHWCEGCIKPVCTNCKDGSHRDHHLITIDEFVNKFEEEVSKFCFECIYFQNVSRLFSIDRNLLGWCSIVIILPV